MKNIIFLCVRYNIRIFSKIFHTLLLILDIIKSKFNLSRRSPVLFNWATTFIPYIQSEERISCVVTGLSNKDKSFILNILEKIKYIAYNNYVDFRKLYSHNDILEQKKYLKYFYKQPSSNYFKKNRYGLVNEYCIDRDMKKFDFNLDNKCILDCGAYIGDSCVSFSDYYPNIKIYAIEPSLGNFTELKNVINLHNKQDKIIPLNIGVGENDTVLHLSNEGIGSKISSIGIPIQVKKIDTIVKEMNIIPGLIKRDIEGYEYYSILGAMDTIKKYKPVLFISIYHHGRDLFEVKKIIQDLDLGYKFTFTRWDSMTAFSDTLLICY